MSTSQAVGAPPEARFFVNDNSGRTLFYPYGTAWHGYVLPDPEREGVLRHVVARHRASVKSLAVGATILIGAVYCAGVALFPFEQHPLLLLTSFVLPPIILRAVERALFRYRLGRLVAGLQRVDSEDRPAARNLRIFLIVTAAVAGLVLLLLYLYDRRIANDAVEAGTIAYFADISEPLAAALMFGFLLFVSFSAWRNIVARVGENKVLLLVLILGVLEVFFIGDAAVLFVNTTPKIVLTSDGLFCHWSHWSVRWADVGNVSLVYGRPRLGVVYAHLKIGKEPDFSLWPSGIEECEVSGLNRDYKIVYDRIREAWLAATGGAPTTPTGDPALDQLAIGETRQQVVAKLGVPTLTAPTPEGSISFYYGNEIIPPVRDPDRHIIAIYFDPNDHVVRLARYGVKDGKIFDSVSKTALLTGVEYPFLEEIFFSKSRGD